jgi:hypothetical protein
MVNYFQSVLVALLASSIVSALPNRASYPPRRPDSLPKTTKHEGRYVIRGKRATQTTYENEAVAGIDALEQWYGSNGLWDDEWWNSANIITMLADFQAFAPDLVSGYTSTIFPYTFNNAPSWGGFTGFIDQYYDDEMWWCLAWIQVFDVTDNGTYLNMAASIFEDAKSAWGDNTCSGLM